MTVRSALSGWQPGTGGASRPDRDRTGSFNRTAAWRALADLGVIPRRAIFGDRVNLLPVRAFNGQPLNIEVSLHSRKRNLTVHDDTRAFSQNKRK